MMSKQSRVSPGILFTWFMLAGLILFFAPERWTNKFKFAFARVFRVPLSIGRSLPLAVPQQASAEVVGLSKYRKLQNHLANTVEWLRQERQKVERLSGLRDRPAWQGTKFILADVITTASGGSQARLIINRGMKDGLSEGQFVCGDYSVVGNLSDVGSRTAEVRLITDPASKVAVKITQGVFPANDDQEKDDPDLAVIMQGSGNDRAKIRLIPAQYKVNVGSVVYAQKKPGLLDTAMIVGTVEQCMRDDRNPLLWDITVRPACDISELRQVTVIIMNP
ncbi:MAG: rod shape-determining protein MreC [Planctomycetota bacterium]|jgi:rod shape-determining protein MreC